MKIEQFFFPLTVAASVIAVYVALRNTNNSAVPSVQANPNYQTAAPAVAAQSQPVTSSVNTNIPLVQPIGSGPQQTQNTDPQYIANAAKHRWANNPNNPSNPNIANQPTYPTILTGALPPNQTYNLPPALSFPKRAAAMAANPSGQPATSQPSTPCGGCGGCSGGCGGSNGQGKGAPYFPGGDTPVVAGPQYQTRALGNTGQNLAGYAAQHGPAAFQHFPWSAGGGASYSGVNPAPGSTTEHGAH
jgi:hypothetical protein